jgi:ABC-2 type transport system ATP-binding protein
LQTVVLPWLIKISYTRYSSSDAPGSFSILKEYRLEDQKIAIKPDGHDTVIRTASLTKRFKTALAVDHAALEVKQGDVFGLLGPNGAGKTTIIRMLLGLVKPTEGRAAIFGFDAYQQRLDVARRVSAIVETPALYPDLTGRANLQAMAMAAGIPHPEKKIEEVLGKMGLAQRAGDRFSRYSLGMKQRLCIASALLTDPDLIILDEPTNGLDPAGMAEIRHLIKDLAAQGRTVFLSSHLLFEVQQVCNRVAVIQRGQIISQGLVSEMLSANSAIYVKVTQEEWEKAWYVLWEAGYGNNMRTEGFHLVVNAPASEGSAINRVLAQAGIYAGEIAPRTQSLEEYYLALTGANQPVPQFQQGGVPGANQ